MNLDQFAVRKNPQLYYGVGCLLAALLLLTVRPPAQNHLTEICVRVSLAMTCCLLAGWLGTKPQDPSSPIEARSGLCLSALLGISLCGLPLIVRYLPPDSLLAQWFVAMTGAGLPFHLGVCCRHLFWRQQHPPSPSP